jgi:hypothetical protein
MTTIKIHIEKAGDLAAVIAELNKLGLKYRVDKNDTDVLPEKVSSKNSATES